MVEGVNRDRSAEEAYTKDNVDRRCCRMRSSQAVLDCHSSTHQCSGVLLPLLPHRKHNHISGSSMVRSSRLQR